MTEQEAQVFAERLTRIWGFSEMSYFFKSYWYFKGSLSQSCSFHLMDLPTGSSWFLSFQKGEAVLGRLNFSGSTGQVSVVPAEYLPARARPTLEQFAAQSLPFFRRGCWLSGCPIDASAHEKAEWMQGFSREEIEAWNLKI